MIESQTIGILCSRDDVVGWYRVRTVGNFCQESRYVLQRVSSYTLLWLCAVSSSWRTKDDDLLSVD